jgi:hypothetical protein
MYNCALLNFASNIIFIFTLKKTNLNAVYCNPWKCAENMFTP